MLFQFWNDSQISPLIISRGLFCVWIISALYLNRPVHLCEISSMPVTIAAPNPSADWHLPWLEQYLFFLQSSHLGEPRASLLLIPPFIISHPQIKFSYFIMDVFYVQGIGHIFCCWKDTCGFFLFQSSVPSSSVLWYPSFLVKSHILLALAQKVNVLTTSEWDENLSKNHQDNTQMEKPLSNIPPRYVATLPFISGK